MKSGEMNEEGTESKMEQYKSVTIVVVIKNGKMAWHIFVFACFRVFGAKRRGWASSCNYVPVFSQKKKGQGIRRPGPGEATLVALGKDNQNDQEQGTERHGRGERG